jgi:hypothetical protein
MIAPRGACLHYGAGTHSTNTVSVSTLPGEKR